MTNRSAEYLDSGMILETIDGAEKYVPDDMGNMDRLALQEWLDAHPDREIAPYVEPDPILTFRSEATLTRADFIIAITMAGVIPQSEALEAAKGEWPSTFAEVLSHLPAAAQFGARVAWATATSISRNHPLISMLINDQSTTLTEEQVDALFGYTG